MKSNGLTRLADIAGGAFRALEVAGGILLLVMMLVTTADVVGRYFFGQSIRGSVEMTQLLLCSVIFLALPYLNWLDAHINVDLAPMATPKGYEWIQHALVNLVSLIAVIALLPKIIALHGRSVSYGDATEFLRIPMHYPLKLIVAMMALSAVAIALRLIMIVSLRGAMFDTPQKGQ